MKKIKAAIIGFGGIARFHYAAYQRLIREGSHLRSHIHTPHISDTDSFAGEIRAIGEAVLQGEHGTCVYPAESAHQSVKLIEALKESAAEGGKNVSFS